MIEGLSSFGTLLKIGDGVVGTESFATIAKVRDISGPQLSLDTDEVTNQDSPGGWEEFVATILRTGQVTFDLVFIPTEETHDPQTGLIADMKNRVLRNFQLVFPDSTSTTWAFSAYVVQFQPSAPVQGHLSASVALKISGMPTLAPAS